jgi:digeranylgeranylglycerophospholipid reductase
MGAREAGLDIVDALIVGGGPGGLFAADRLARRGHRVLVCEEHGTIGEPVHCTGIVAADSFDEFDLPRDTVLNALTRVTFVSPSLVPIGYTTPRPEAVVIDRGRFDRALADRARRAGAEVRTGVRVTDLEIDDQGVRARAGGVSVRARLVVLACGAAYRAQRRLGLGLPGSFLHTAQSEMPAARLGDVEVHFGQDVAPAGFAWAVPVERPSGPHVRIGVMTSHDAPRYFRQMLARVAAPWGVAPDAARPRLKILPLGVIGRTHATRLLVVGDAAGLVKPTTGGGIYYSILSAALAAETADRALLRDRLDAASLAPYESAWRARLASELNAQHALRRAAVAMSDTDIDRLFDLARTDGVMPLVRKTARFNEHRHLIRALFKHPPARRILFRALVA